ncbi:MAG TPA: galactose-1-phosphate uridylyltransferase [Bacteroidota bacterium]
MSEIRQDVTTKEWVIFARERAKRPDDFRRIEDRSAQKLFMASCPFCPGNEEMTIGEVYRQSLSRNSTEWRLRIVPNLFPALVGEGSLSRVVEGALFHRLDGVGQHEVVIETPIHNRFLFDMDESEVLAIINAYRERFAELRRDKRIKVILIFKNHGKSAGTSLEHPHSQIIATPVVPAHIRNKYEIATAYYDDTERCIYCDVAHEEMRLKTRVILTTDLFVAFHPFASRAPFETWIAPLRHCSSFGNITDEEAADFARILQIVLKKMYVGLGNPDFNYDIHTSPLADEDKHYYLWHMQILPKLITPAGFELGSGMSINTALPEETAEFMRGIQLNNGELRTKVEMETGP